MNCFDCNRETDNLIKIEQPGLEKETFLCLKCSKKRDEEVMKECFPTPLKVEFDVSKLMSMKEDIPQPPTKNRKGDPLSFHCYKIPQNPDRLRRG